MDLNVIDLFPGTTKWRGIEQIDEVAHVRKPERVRSGFLVWVGGLS